MKCKVCIITALRPSCGPGLMITVIVLTYWSLVATMVPPRRPGSTSVMDTLVDKGRHIPNTTWLRYTDGSVHIGPMISNRSMHWVIRESIISILCTAPAMKTVQGPGPFGFGNQLGAGLGGIADLIRQGHRVNTTGFHFLDSNIALPGHTPHGAMINAASHCTSPD